MGDEDHRLLVRVPDAHQLEAELLAGHGVERGERLVHQKDRGIVDERAAQRHPLLHAAGELPRIAPLEPAEPDESDEVHGAGARFPLVEPENFRGQKHVVENRAPLQQHGLLKHDADIARGMEERGAVEQKLAAAGADERADELEQGRFAATRRANEGDELVLFDRERDVCERRHPTVTRSVGLVQPLDLDLAQAG